MSVKIAISGIAGFLDLALLPIKSVFGQVSPIATAASPRKVVLMTPAADGVSVESSVCLGERDACCAAAIELMGDQRKLALEGFQIEEVAALCFVHNYRWRLDSDPVRRSRFVLEPGVKPLPRDEVTRKPSKSSGGGE